MLTCAMPRFFAMPLSADLQAYAADCFSMMPLRHYAADTLADSMPLLLILLIAAADAADIAAAG